MYTKKGDMPPPPELQVPPPQLGVKRPCARHEKPRNPPKSIPPVKRRVDVPDETLSVAHDDELKYAGFLSARSVHQQKLFSLHHAVLFPQRSSENDVESLLWTHIQPQLFIASEGIHMRLQELRRTIYEYKDASGSATEGA